MKKVREEMGLTNVQLMVPFVRNRRRSTGSGRTCWPNTGSSSGENDLKLIMMCEIPSNALLADEFLDVSTVFRSALTI